MLHRERLRLPDHIFPRDPWTLRETRYAPRFLPLTETLFSVANGYLGLRGSFEEDRGSPEGGVYINGFYESWPIPYGESAFGFATTGQTMLSVPDGRIIRLFIDDEPFEVAKADLLHFERSLDMQRGLLHRKVIWETPSGKHVQLESERLVSFAHRHVAAITYRVTLLNADAPIVVVSELRYTPPQATAGVDPRQMRGFVVRPLESELQDSDGLRLRLAYRTAQSGLRLACGVDHQVHTECQVEHHAEVKDDLAKVIFGVDAEAGKEIRIDKFMVYHTAGPQPEPVRELCARLDRTLDRVTRHGFADLLDCQRHHMDSFWAKGDVKLEGDPSVQQVLRFNLFHIWQACARAEGTGVPAKGLTGGGYEGHYFWDIEIYVLPFLIYTEPRIARNLLRFRYNMLDKARERARQVNQKGALFAWRTINGEEASSYYAAGTAQYHINADIIWALRKYVEISGDEDFLQNEGAEMLVETARLWEDLGFYSPRRGGKFCIHGVTGPDEYNTVVDNNTYTNLMARENLRFAAQTLRWLKQKHPGDFAACVHRTHLDEAEIDAWERAAEAMFIPFDESAKIHPQDDGFLDREVWDLANTPKEHFPLLLHYHPLVIYRSQVIKQADVVLAMFLLGHAFSAEQKKRNFDYYDPLTTGDSSLSVSVQSILALELGYREIGREYSRYAALMDLADIGGNVQHGVHIASMGGTWMATVYGHAGLRDFGGELYFNPRLPEHLERASFRLQVRGRVLAVILTQRNATYSLEQGGDLSMYHSGRPLSLAAGQSQTLSIDPDVFQARAPNFILRPTLVG
ncbi:MAG: glycoside hydrolase family 65 protein [Polyangiales bacterium]